MKNIVDYQIYNSDADVTIQTQLTYREQLEKMHPLIQLNIHPTQENGVITLITLAVILEQLILKRKR